jgi:glycosyltransferase involved in cell wall biosynthesis
VESVKADFIEFEYEIIMVNDGSKDKSWNEIKECA